MYLLHSLLPGTTPNLSWHIYKEYNARNFGYFLWLIIYQQYIHTRLRKSLFALCCSSYCQWQKKICSKRQSFDRRIHSTYRITNYWVYSISDKKENQKIKYTSQRLHTYYTHNLLKYIFRQEVVINVYDMFLIF